MRQNCKAHNLVNNLLDYMYDGNNDIKLCDGKICDQIKKDTNNVEDIEFYIPEQKDTLFWCFYNAYNKDYLKDKFFTIEKEFKIGFIEIARKNKETLKNIRPVQHCPVIGCLTGSWGFVLYNGVAVKSSP